MLRCVLRMALHDHGEARDSQILQIVRAGLDESGNGIRGGVQQFGIRIDLGDALDAFVHDGVSCVDAHVGLFQCLVEDFVHSRTGIGIGLAQQGKDSDDLDLHPRCRHAVVVEFRRQPVLTNLLEDADQRWDQIFEGSDIVNRHRFDDVQARPHDCRVSVAQHLAHLFQQLIAGDCAVIELVEPMQADDGLLANGLAVVRQQLADFRRHGGDHVARHELRGCQQPSGDFQHIRRLQIPLHLVDEHETELVVG
mmetsp:Transcript_11220/g.32281  ORF Transcript_11220/g.32281 Transcript_11220/m.32281 type:complete len:252 (-) Transcript_11220:469-1224(-)